jgi:hypothetical protein
MSAKDVVQVIYSIIQDDSRGEQAIYLDLLEESSPTYDDLNKYLCHSNASEDAMKNMRLFRMDGNDFILMDWRDEKRQAYIQREVQDANSDLTELDKAQFLRYYFEQDKDANEYLARWSNDDLKQLCEGLAEASGDETFLTMVGVDTTLSDYSGD